MVAIVLETFGLFYDERPVLFVTVILLVLGSAVVIWLVGTAR